MPPPTHGFGCRTQTFAAPCRDCGDAIYVFLCNHGSVVLFASLGDPWIRHNCRKGGGHRPRKPSGGYISLTTAFRRHLAEGTITISIDRAYQQQVRAAIDPRKRVPSFHREIVRMDPYDGVVADEIGILRERHLDVDIYRRLGIPETAVSAALLDSLASEQTSQVTVHTQALGEEDNSSFTFFMPKKWLVDSGARRGDLVAFQLRGVVLSGTPFWRCTFFECLN